jgi:hypothetical protein
MEFEPTVSASERLQTHTLDRPATGIGTKTIIQYCNITYNSWSAKTVSTKSAISEVVKKYI